MLFTTHIVGKDTAATPSLLVLETAASPDTGWTAFAKFALGATITESVLLTTLPYSEANRLQELIRWRWILAPVVGPYFVSFRIKVALKP